MSDSLAVVVGVSHYSDSSFARLPGAAADAQRVATSLRAWGYDKADVLTLTNSAATRHAILRALRVWPLQDGRRFRRLFFYFAGHGAHVSEVSGARASVLLTCDTTADDRAGTGVLLSEILSALRRARPREAYLLLDACYQRIEHLEYPFVDADADLVSKATTASEYFFCLAAAGNAVASEDKASGRGVFTSSLLSNLAHLRHSGHRSITALAASIRSDLLSRGYPAPVQYSIGNTDGWPLPLENLQPQLPTGGGDLISRPRLFAVFADALALAKGRTVWLSAPSGAGKSVAGRQWAKSVGAIFVTVEEERGGTAERVLQSISASIVDEMPAIFPSGRRPSGSIKEVLEFLTASRTHLVVVADQVERLSSEEQRALLTALAAVGSLDVVLLSSQAPPAETSVYRAELPLLDDTEILAFARILGSTLSPDLSFWAAASGRLPLRLRGILAAGVRSIHDLFSAAPDKDVVLAGRALAIAGGYVNAALFRRALRISTASVAWLEDCGLISSANDHFDAHDELRKYTHAEIDADLQRRVGLYWALQLRDTPQHLWAARRVLRHVERYGYSRTLDSAIHHAADLLIAVNDWESISRVVSSILQPQRPTRALLLIAREAAHIARHDVVDRILDHYGGANQAWSSAPENFDRVEELRLIECERLFWGGDYASARKLALLVLKSSPSARRRALAHLNYAICEFFEGQWVHARSHLAYLHDSNEVDARTAAWSWMIDGTIEALRGTDIRGGIAALRRAIRMLKQTDDEVGLAIALNNLGECLWKTREYQPALLELTQARALARGRGDQATELEIVRNLLHTEVRLRGARSENVITHMRDLTALLERVTDATEHMQAWNTLATAALRAGDTETASNFIRRAQVYTRSNPEYDIYTLANDGIQHALHGDSGAATRLMSKAIALAEQGQNYLALVQIHDDIEYFVENVSAAEIEAALDAALEPFTQLEQRTLDKMASLQERYA